jgi:hypothetical protein
MFVFLHVPKTAGLTLDHIIMQQHQARGSRFPFYKPGVWDPQEAACQQDATEVFYGHLHLGVHRYLTRPVTYYTLLRDPVERAISHYYFSLHNCLLAEGHPDQQRALEGKLTLEYYVSSGHCREMDNPQTRLLAGESGLYDRVPFGHCTGALLEEAKDHLRENIHVVGLTEQFDASLLLIQRLCGWRTPYYVKHNVTLARPRQTEVSATALAAIQERTQLDRKLYAYAVELFQEQVDQQGSPFRGDVRRFQERNRRYGRWMARWNRVTRKQRRILWSVSDLLSQRRPIAPRPGPDPGI